MGHLSRMVRVLPGRLRLVKIKIIDQHVTTVLLRWRVAVLPGWRVLLMPVTIGRIIVRGVIFTSRTTLVRALKLLLVMDWLCALAV